MIASVSLDGLTRPQQEELYAVLDELGRRKRLEASKFLGVWAILYGWQRDFIAATARYHECCLIAANQIGKSFVGCQLDAAHLLGEYPEDWTGHKFDFAPLCWGLGYSMEKTRDLLQRKLFGVFRPNEGFDGGLIPKDRIVDWQSISGVPGAMRTVRVKHRLGISTIQFWAYTQGQHAIMGDVVDFVHVDEEPKDQTIRPQLLTRTINGDNGRGGRIVYTFTPENGRTELVIQFMDTPSESQYYMQKGWDDAPHITPETRERLLESYPEYQRDMRSKGHPLMGSGAIFEHSQQAITCKRFEIPGHFYLINGMDFGWDHPQAHVQLAIDPDSATIYVIQAWKGAKRQPWEAWQSVKAWAAGVPTAWPADGLQTEKGSAKQQKDYYEEAGWLMIDEHATWKDGGTGVEAGLMELNNLMKTSKFKVFDDLQEVLEEIRDYHRKQMPSGLSQIVKIKDDLICAIRYAYMMAREAIQKSDLTPGDEAEEYVQPRHNVNAGGY